MSLYSILFLIIDSAALLLLPRRFFIPSFLAGVCYTTVSQLIEVGGMHLTILRILIIIGILRIIMRGEHISGDKLNRLDWIVLFWGLWMLFSSIFHEDPKREIVFRSGLFLDALGPYLIFRVFFKSSDDISSAFGYLAILLIPIAIEMIVEHLTSTDLFYELAGNSKQLFDPEKGRIRAVGPFIHAILAGTAGALSFPLIVTLWFQRNRIVPLMGIAACLIIVITSTSSGPIMSLLIASTALIMWRYKHLLRPIKWIALLGYILLTLVMKEPAYYIMDRIDFIGGSGGWHRARLIESSIEHINEWWLYGTDYTRHWMPSGVTWSANHTDITNHYIHMGVTGGVLLMILFIMIIGTGFTFVGRALKEMKNEPKEIQFIVWSLGAALFTHAVTFISVRYFDQSIILFYMTLAAIGSLQAVMQREFSVKVKQESIELSEKVAHHPIVT